MSNQTKNATLVGGGGQKPLNNQSLETKNPRNAKGLDSKSKLESKNPNKIQTAKIQDSKTSKDSMKLESSPKLDSKTSQKSNKESETKQAKKIQRAKNTCDSKKLTNSQKSKIKSFIRTIPISIALASALSSQAVAGWQVNGGGSINNGTITSSISSNSSSVISSTSSGTITDITIANGVTLTRNNNAYDDNTLIKVHEYNASTLINLGTLQTNGSMRTLFIKSKTMDSFINQGVVNNSYYTFLLQGQGTLGTFINEGGTITNSGSGGNGNLFHLEGSSHIGQITINGGSIRSGGNFIDLGGSSTIGNIAITDNANVENTSSNRTSIDLSGGSVTGTISVEDTASLKSNINISSNNRIGGGIIIGAGSDSPTFSGNITLNNGSILGQGIQVNSGTMTSNVSLSNQSNISKIFIGSSGGNTSKLEGNITLNNTSAIANGITIANGGTYAGTIHNRDTASIGGIVVDNGTIVGNIIASGASRLNGITIVNGGEMRGNIEARWMSDSTGNAMNLGDIDIQSRLQGGITLANAATIESLSLSNGGTITNAVSIGAGGSNNQTSILKTITLSGNSGINSLVVGSSNNNAGTIDSITLNDNSNIGNINVAERGTITNLTVGSIAQTGSITNAGKLQNIALNGTSTITNGITNASGGTISNITLASSNTINNGITNNSGGNIGTITSNTNNINNTITNSGTINELVVSKGTITYIDNSNSGVVDSLLQVEDGATLKMGSSGNGTITIGSDLGSVLDLKQGSTFEGNLKNASVIKEWKNVSNIDGSFINDTGASVVDLTAGQISQNLLNEGNITNLIINKNIGTLTNNGSGVINTLVIQDNSNIDNGIRNNSNIGSLNLQENVTYDGSGSITNALDIAGTKTLTATNNGINILFDTSATGTINNAGIIDGSLTNTASSTIKSFNTGSITGSITNSGSIQTLNVNDTIAGITNSQTIDSLKVDSSITNGITNAGNITTLTNNQANTNITNNQNIGTLDIKANTTYAGAGSITNALDINGVQTQFTISNGAGNNGTLTLTDTAGANSVKTITNEGTIIGNLINDLTSTDWTFGVLQGNFTNNGNLTAFNTGSITGILTNGNKGIIKTLNTSKVRGSIANNGNLVNVIVDADKTLTGNGSITNSLVVEKNNGGNGYTLTIGSGGTGNLDFKATNGTINNAGTIVGNITNVSGSTIADFTNSGSFNGALTNNGSITNFINSGNFTGNITNTAGDTISNFNNQGNITGNINNSGTILVFNNAGNIDGTLTNASNANIGDFTNSGSIKEFNNQGLIAFYENSGTIGSFNNTGTIYGVLNSKVINGNFENVANALKNTGTISGNVELVGQRGTCNSSTICQLSGLWNEGTITGTFTNAANKTINSVINGSNSKPNINAVLNNGIANDGTINKIHNYSNGTINNGITNNANANIESINNEGIINGGITNSSQIGMINNTGLITGNLTNNTDSIITTINTGSITGSIANSGEITTLNVTGNVTNGITNNSNITNLTINKGVNLGNNGITNNANIGSLLVNESVSYKGTGSISNALEVAKDKTLTATNGITFNATKGSVNNLGTIAGNLTLKGSSNTLSNAGTINGNLTNSANTSTIANYGSINGTIINNATNGTIINANNSNIAALDINESVIYNQGTNANITSNIDIAQGKTLTATNGITLNATNGSVNNEGILAGILTLEGSSNSVTNSGSITTIINNANNSNLTNNSNIGALEVNKNLNYSGSGSITNYAIIAENTTLNNSTALIFASNNQGLENKGIITGSLENKGNMQLLSNSGTTSQINGDITNSGLITNLANQGTISGDITNKTNSTITNFTNSGTITGDLYNDGHIDTLTNKGTMGTIYNTSKNTIENLLNDKNSVIAGIDNSNGKYNTLENQGTILGDIKNDNGTITNLVNTNNGTITGQIISNGTSNIGTIANAGVINSSHTMNSGSIQDKTNDAISLNTITNVVTAISNSGSINGNVRVAGNSEVNVIENSKVIAGCIILEGGRIGNINNTNGAIANCMSFSNGASVDNLNNSGTIKDKITNNSGSITVNNSGSIGGITTSNGGNTTIINGGMDKPGGNIGAISNKDNSNTHIDGWTLDNPDNPNNPIIIADGSDKNGIHLKEDSIFVEGNLESGKIYDYYDYIQNEKGDSIGQDFSQDDELFNALTFIDIFNPTDNGDGTYSVGLDTRELSGKTLGASLIYSSRMRQINTNSMLREINVKNFKTDFEILEQRERLKNQQALLENYKQQRESYLNGLTKDNKELKRVSSKESTSLSTYANNSNIKSDAIEVVDYYNKDTLASLDNLQATTKANQETYSNLDLLRELDDIFISHTGDKDNLYTFALPYTRYTSAQLDGGVGTLKSHASGILAGAQAKLPSERGILGIYFGYESSDKQVGQQRLDFDEKVYYGGLTYYNVFARKGVSEYYLSANTRIDKGDTDLYKTYRTGSTTINSQVDSYGYGADLKVGANYYNIYNNSVLSPEIGISYQGISTDSFRLRHLGGVSEHYYAQDVNFFDISATLRWQRAWNNVFKTMASLGAMYNVYNDAKGSGVIAGLKQSADINVEELYGTTQVGISYALGENANIALNYSGIFANGVQSHAGYIRLGVWW